jgi:hypothetical protein
VLFNNPVRKILAILSLFTIFLLFSGPSTVFANPAFARKFGFSCVMCHAGFPKLNSFGEDFAANGYQFPGRDGDSSSDTYGDPKLRLEKSLNLAVRVDSFLRYRRDTSVHSDIEAPFLLKLFIIGYLTKDVTFYSYFLADEGGEVVGLEDAFLYLNNLWGRELDLQLGQFQVMDSFFAREQRLTFQDIEIYLTHVSKSSFKLTYQRGINLFYGLSYGPSDFGLTAGVVNGNGIGVQDQNGNFDQNTPKDFFGRAAFTAGPVGIGLFGYQGRSRDQTTGFHNSFWRFGPDLRIRELIQKVDLRAQWLFGRDNNPDFLLDAISIRHSGGFVELDYHFNADWIGVLLYNRVMSSNRSDIEKNLGTINMAHYFLRNLKVFLEYTKDFEPISTSHLEKTDTAIIGLVFAF